VATRQLEAGLVCEDFLLGV